MDFIFQNLEVILTFIGFIVSALIWLVRLEGRVKFNKETFETYQKDQKEDDRKRDEKIGKIFDLLGEVKSSVDKIEGFLQKP